MNMPKTVYLKRVFGNLLDQEGSIPKLVVISNSLEEWDKEQLIMPKEPFMTYQNTATLDFLSWPILSIVGIKKKFKS